MAQNRGIQNSGMMLGLMQGDNARKDTLINENVSVRDQRINTITDRLNAIKNNSSLDTANAHANYGYGVANARGQADSQRYQNEFAMGLEDMQANRDQGFTQDNMNMQQGFTQDNMQLQQGYTQDNMGLQQGYTQDNMKLQQQFDLSKMSVQQQNTLEQMAKSFGYDLSKMSKAQQYQLANMATSFGYDMRMQNDSQGHQSNMAYNDRLFQEKMFGKEQGAKMAEYDLALQRELSSYNANTPEGKLRIKQLEASKDAMVTEMMSKTIGELMGQTFISKYGEGMTTKQMESWLKDPTNLKNLEMKVKNTDLPEEKKGFLDAIIKGSRVATPIGAIYSGFSKLWNAGKEAIGGNAKSFGGVWGGKVTSNYGNRTHPVTGKKNSFHNGVDYASPNGTKIPSTVAGKVIASGSATKFGYDSSYGTIVVVKDAQGRQHLYAHMSGTDVKVGSSISAGTSVGRVGSTGRSTGNHVHYTVKHNGKNINPNQFIG